MTTETKCLRGECNTPSSCRAYKECLALDPPEDSRELGSLYAGAPSIEPETETVADVLADLDAMAAECGGLEAATIHAMTQRIAAAHAREVEQAKLRDAPCARLCEATAFEIEIRHLKAANIAYSSENASLRGRAMAAEKKMETQSRQIDAFLAHCADGECAECARIICPHGSGFHFHHDGCPVCESTDAAMGEPVREVLR